jgi:ketosteroid isomerase-like protein
MPNLISKVKELYAAFGRGEVATIVANVAHDVSWEFEASPELLSSGIRRSPKEVAEYFAAIASQSVDQQLQMTDFFSSDDAVVVFGRFQGTIVPYGIRVDTPVAHYLRSKRSVAAPPGLPASFIAKPIVGAGQSRSKKRACKTTRETAVWGSKVAVFALLVLSSGVS